MAREQEITSNLAGPPCQRNGKWPLVAVTMGDPAGVGPELCLRLLTMEPELLGALPIVVGSGRILRQVARAANLPGPEQVAMVPTTADGSVVRPKGAALLDLDGMDGAVADAEAVVAGQAGAAAGRLAARAVERAISLAQVGDVDAVCTGPANKQSLQLAGVPFPGHTEWFAERTDAERWCMCFHADDLIVSLATIHIGYADVPTRLTIEGLVEVIELTGNFARGLLGREPRLAVLGLNPHAGEGGRFGLGEEERIVQPAIDRMRGAGWQVEGPLPPDTAFIPARRSAMDGYVCLYHDQGLIPLKMLAFDRAVNVTLGLPIIRTSVDHGTAYDIAWQGRADVGSLVEAVRLAGRMAGSS